MNGRKMTRKDMKMMKLGYISGCTNNNDRYEIGFDDRSDYELHCGDIFDIQNEDLSWENVRIEYEYGYYLVTEKGNRDMPIRRTRIRM